MQSNFHISFYQNKSAKSKLKDDSIICFFNDVVSGLCKDQILQIRNNPKLDSSLLIKSNLPCVTISGTFGADKSADSLIKHSGLIQIDIDHAEDAIALKAILSADPFTFISFISPSGDGVKLIVKIPSNPASHLNSFLALEQYYLDNYNVSIDKSCKNFNRICYYSYDPDAFINYNSSIFYNQIVLHDSIHQNVSVTNTVNDFADTSNIYSILSSMIDKACDGQKHHILVKASYLAGGYVSGNLISESNATEFLENCISKKNIKSFKAAQVTIRNSIKAGKLHPLFSTNYPNVIRKTNNKTFFDFQYDATIVSVIRSCFNAHFDYNSNEWLSVYDIPDDLLFNFSKNYNFNVITNLNFNYLNQYDDDTDNSLDFELSISSNQNTLTKTTTENNLLTNIAKNDKTIIREVSFDSSAVSQQWDIVGLSDFFSSATLPVGPVALDNIVTITEVASFVNTNLCIVIENANNETYFPYYERLLRLKNYLLINK